MTRLSKRAYLPVRILFITSALFLFPTDSWSDGGRPLSEVQKSGRLVVGVDIPYGVMEFYGADGKPAGIDIDISKEIAAGIGVMPEFRAMAFDNLFEALKKNEVDVVLSAVTITPERHKTLLFSIPYLSASTVLAVAKDNTAAKSIADIADARLGVLKGTLGEKMAGETDVLKGMTPVPYANNDERIADLVAGKIDAAVVHFLVKTDLPIKIIGEPLRQNFYGAVAHMDSKDLIAEIDKILRAMKRDGRLTAIKRRYIK